jgi:hypothetical protein
MSFLLVGAAVVGVGAGVAKAISGSKAKKAAKKAEAAAKVEMEKQKAKFAAMDTSNPYANQENTMEDLTVNQGEADFMKQQQQQSQANIMQQMKGAAGGSGIAALAQTMANQGSMDAQKSAVSIGKQEQGNQMAEASQQAQLNQREASGDRETQRMNLDRQGTMLGMSQQEKAAQGAKVAAADQKMWSGITGAAGALAGGMTGMASAGGSTPGDMSAEQTIYDANGSPMSPA